MNKDESLVVSEIFYSIQGEGPSTGRPAVFLRLGGCNLLCGGRGLPGTTWTCDTIEVWQKSERMHFGTVCEIIDKQLSVCERLDNVMLVITGGEPLIHQATLPSFMRFLNEYFSEPASGVRSWQPYVEVETNGTITPTDELEQYVDQFNVSPKLASSMEEFDKRYKPETLKHFAEQVNPYGGLKNIFKFVVAKDSDVEEISTTIEFTGLLHESIWLMPAGSSQDELKETRIIASHWAKVQGWFFTDRMHISVWNKKTGV